MFGARGNHRPCARVRAEVSRSVDDDELKLQRQGYATAVSNPRVLQAITAGLRGAVAICFIERSGPEEQQVVAEWTVVRDGEGAAAFAATLLHAPRSFVGRTSISAAIDFSRTYLSKLYAVAGRQIIDISSDGTNNSGRPVVDARNEAVIAGGTINGIAIINEHPEDNDYAIDHTSIIFLIDAIGRPVFVFSHEMQPDRIARRIKEAIG
jgi:uncharacterized protein DUF1194